MKIAVQYGWIGQLGRNVADHVVVEDNNEFVLVYLGRQVNSVVVVTSMNSDSAIQKFALSGQVGRLGLYVAQHVELEPTNGRDFVTMKIKEMEGHVRVKGWSPRHAQLAHAPFGPSGRITVNVVLHAMVDYKKEPEYV